MSKFQKLDVVYRAGRIACGGADWPFVIPVLVSDVCPQRDGSTRYHCRIVDGMPARYALGWFNVYEGELFGDPEAALSAARGTP